MLSPILSLLWNGGEADWHRISEARGTSEQIEQTLLQITRDIARTTVSKQTLRANLECGLQSFKSLHARVLERFLSLEKAMDEQAEAIGQLLRTDRYFESHCLQLVDASGSVA